MYLFPHLQPIWYYYNRNHQMGNTCTYSNETPQEKARHRLKQKGQLEKFKKKYESETSFQKILNEVQQRRQRLKKPKNSNTSKQRTYSKKRLVDEMNVLLEILYKLYTSPDFKEQDHAQSRRGTQGVRGSSYHNKKNIEQDELKDMIPVEVAEQKAEKSKKEKLIEHLTRENQQLRAKQKLVQDILQFCKNTEPSETHQQRREQTIPALKSKNQGDHPRTTNTDSLM